MKFKNGMKEKHIIVKCGADKFLPFALMFGFYVILFGTGSSGGGFQGGTIVAAGALLVYLGYGVTTAQKALNLNVLRTNEFLGASVYILLGFAGLLFATQFAENFCPNLFGFGDMISAGTITFMGYSVGYKVLTGVSFLLVLMLGLLAPDFDNDDDGYVPEEEDE